MLVEVVIRKCSVKKVFLKILQNLQGNTCVSLLNNTFAGIRFQHKCFPVSCANFLGVAQRISSDCLCIEVHMAMTIFVIIQRLSMVYSYQSFILFHFFISFLSVQSQQQRHQSNIHGQKHPFRTVLRKRCSENMQQIYRRTPIPKCDFNNVAFQPLHNTQGY